jgi:hypothetical protein
VRHVGRHRTPAARMTVVVESLDCLMVMGDDVAGRRAQRLVGRFISKDRI